MDPMRSHRDLSKGSNQTGYMTRAMMGELRKGIAHRDQSGITTSGLDR